VEPSPTIPANFPVIFGNEREIHDAWSNTGKLIIAFKRWDILFRIGLVIIIAVIIGTFSLAPHAVAPNSYAVSASNTLTVSSLYGTTSGSGSYSNGSVAIFSVTPTVVYSSSGTTRYVFDGWSCSGGGCYSGSASSTSIVMNTNITETTNWITQFLLSASVTGNGTVTPVGENWYNAGTVVSVSESSNGGPSWLFAYWNLDGTNAGSSQIYTLEMNSKHDIVANFIEPGLKSSMLNVSDSFADNLRNPDGTFYKLDEFKISYNVYLMGGNPLPPDVNFRMNVAFPMTALLQSETGYNYSSFVVLPTAPPGAYRINVTAFIFNSADNSTRAISISSYEPFAVVDYSPHFTCFAYPDFNSQGASSYEKPFVVIFRYTENSPGFSYSGDINTDPFNAVNSTRERAIINGFNFSTEGWSANLNLSNDNMNDSFSLLQFEDHPNLTLAISPLNYAGRPVVITWQNRLQKFYFSSNTREIENYVSNSIIYLNVTLSADYSVSYNSYDFKSTDSLTSYLYQPIVYNGYLAVSFPEGSQENISVSITSHNPSPLTSYLTSEASRSLLGSGNNDTNDSQAISSIMEPDLYPANFTTSLKPEEPLSNSTDWIFSLNQTNVALFPNMDGMPYFTISVSGNVGYTVYNFDPGNPPYNLSISTTNYTGKSAEVNYNFTDYFGLALLSDFPGGFPFHNLMGYYLIQASPGEDLVMQPLGFSFNGSSSVPYLIRTYDNSSAPFFISYEPGNLSASYPMLYGENETNFLSPDFARAGLIGMGIPRPIDGGSFYQISLLFGAQGDGASRVWVVSDNGQVLCNESLVDSSSNSSIGLNGYTGEFTLQFPTPDTSNSVTIYVQNSWGGISEISGIEISPHAPPSLTFPVLELSGILVTCFAISYGYIVFGARKKQMT
jgi:hypothetical protein